MEWKLFSAVDLTSESNSNKIISIFFMSLLHVFFLSVDFRDIDNYDTIFHINLLNICISHIVLIKNKLEILKSIKKCIVNLKRIF